MGLRWCAWALGSHCKGHWRWMKALTREGPPELHFGKVPRAVPGTDGGQGPGGEKPPGAERVCGQNRGSCRGGRRERLVMASGKGMTSREAQRNGG